LSNIFPSILDIAKIILLTFSYDFISKGLLYEIFKISAIFSIVSKPPLLKVNLFKNIKFFGKTS
jgi:hypothetical protein